MKYADLSRNTGMERPAQWLAVLRIIVGLYFAKAVFTKLGLVMVGGFLPLPGASERWVAVMPKLLAKYMDGNPIGWYRTFVEQTALTHVSLFANLTALGEAVVGISLTLGLLTGVGSIVGLILAISYGLAVQWMSPGQQGFHIVLVTAMIAFFFARAGRTWGLDAWIAGRQPPGFLARRPWS